MDKSEIVADALKKCQKEEGAKRYDFGKLRWDLIPYDALEKVVEVYTHGSAKYDDENWRNGMNYKRMYGSIMRHLTKWYRGEDIDKDSGCLHLSNVVWGCLSLIWMQMNDVGEDNRIKDNNIDTDLVLKNRECFNKQVKMFQDIYNQWFELKEKNK